jgi:hypothetical protein
MLFTVMMAIRFSETSVITRATRNHIPDDGIFFSNIRLFSVLKVLRYIELDPLYKGEQNV